MSTEYYPATSYIGGGAGALDKIPSATLGTGEIALVSNATVFSVHYYDADSAAGESSPDVIAPDDVGGNGRWLMVFSKAGGGLSWSVISVNTNAANGNGYLIDASGGNITLTLPASPSAGDAVGACDVYNKATTNIITIDRNGENIEGSATDLIIDINGSGITLVYTDAVRGWEIISEVGYSIPVSFQTIAVLGTL